MPPARPTVDAVARAVDLAIESYDGYDMSATSLYVQRLEVVEAQVARLVPEAPARVADLYETLIERLDKAKLVPPRG